MTIVQLGTFLKIAETKSFTSAAAQLGYAQSTVTTQIRQLEENEARFRHLLQVVRDAKKQRQQITLMQALDRIK